MLTTWLSGQESACNTRAIGDVGREDALEEGVATHSSILAWRAYGQRSLAGHSP